MISENGCFSDHAAGARTGVAELDPLLAGADVDDALDENAGGMDVVRIDLAGRHQMLDLGDGDLGGGRHHRVKIARGLAVDQVPGGIALPGVDDGEVGEQAALHDVFLAVEFLHFLAFGDQRADAGLGVEGRNTGAAGADALGQRALRIEFEFQFAGEVLLGEQLVLADIGRDHLLDLPGLQQPAQPDAVDAGIVGDHGQVLDAGLADRVRQGFGDAAKTKTARHDHHAVLENAIECRFGVGVDLVHGYLT